MALNAALAGKLYEPRSFVVTAEAINKYAHATNDDNPRFTSDDPVAPPAFPFVAAMEPMREVMLDPDLSVDMAMLVHAEQDHRLVGVIRAGDRLSVTARLEAVDLAATGHNFTVAVSLTGEGGDLAAEVISRMFIRKTGKGKAQEEPEQKGPVVAEATSKVDDDQTYRYAEASGDHNPIHLDPEAARRSGFPGIVCHGMCTMAMASKVVLDGVAGGDPARLRRIKVQFSRPVFPGQTLTTSVWRKAGGEEEAGSAAYGFEAVNPRGASVIRNGLAVVLDAT
jgi:acyl dehydratase